MSGLKYLLSEKFLHAQAEEKPETPQSFQEGLEELLSYCRKQVPSILETDFMPACFDITKDEETLVIGGQHGNIAVYNISGKNKLRDEEICGEHSITTVMLVLNEQQVVLCSSKCDIYFLEFPTLRVLHRLELNYIPAVLNEELNITSNPVLKLGSNEEWLYYCKYDQEIQVLRLGAGKGYYAKKFETTSILTESNVMCIDVSEDGTLIAAGTEDGKIGLIHADTQTNLQNTGETDSKPIIVTFGLKRKFIAAGFDNNAIRVWNLDSKFSLIFEYLERAEIITGLTFTNDNRYLVSGSADYNIMLWDMKVESHPHIMNMFDSKVVHLRPSRDHKKIYFSQAYNAIMSWEIPQLHKNASYNKHTHKVNKLIFLPNSFELLSIGMDGLAVLWDFRNDLMQDFVQLEGSLVDAAVPSEAPFVMICSSKPCIYRWDFTTGCLDEFDFNSPGIAIVFSSDDFTLAASDSLSRVIIYDADVMERKFIFKGHRFPVSAMAFIKDNAYLLTASMDCEIGKWDTETGEKIQSFKGHKNSIRAMITTSNDWIISSSDEAIIIWNFDGVLIYTIPISLADAGKIVGLYMSADNSYLVGLQENHLSYWQTDNLSIMFQIDTDCGGCLAMSIDEKMVAIAEGSTILIEENPMNSSSVRLVGKNQGSRYKYMRFIMDSQKKNSKAVYSESHNHWVAVPYLIGISHILSFSNRIDDLNDALFEAENKAGYFSTINSENPLSICVELEYKNVIDVCLKYMKAELTRKNLRAFASIEKCLTTLNTIEYPDIAKVYDLIFQKAEGTHLPDFCLHETDLPLLHTSDSLVVIPEEIVPKEFFSSTGRPVVFHHSLCLLDMELGTTASLEFLESLLNGGEAVYYSRIVKEFLQCKWDKIQTVVNTQGCIYIIYMFLLSVYTVSFMQDNNFLYSVIFVHLILFSIEILQLATDYKNYFFDVWNIFDLMRTWSFFIYVFSVFLYEEYSYNKLLAVIIFSWLRGISYFRMFDGTRYMVRLLGKVILDMRVFFTILAYSTIGFAFIFYLRNPSTPFLLYLTTSYRLDLGDFNTDYTALFDWVVFFLATMMNPMIMLNLLISILSDTAARVSAENYVANLQELCRMIIEVERVMFWKKNGTNKHFLHMCNFIEDDPQPDKVLEKCKFIKSKLDKMQRNLDAINQQMASVNVVQIESSVKYMIQEQQNIKEEMNCNFEKNNSMLARIGEKLASNQN